MKTAARIMLTPASGSIKAHVNSENLALVRSFHSLDRPLQELIGYLWNRSRQELCPDKNDGTI